MWSCYVPYFRLWNILQMVFTWFLVYHLFAYVYRHFDRYFTNICSPVISIIWIFFVSIRREMKKKKKKGNWIYIFGFVLNSIFFFFYQFFRYNWENSFVNHSTTFIFVTIVLEEYAVDLDFTFSWEYVYISSIFLTIMVIDAIDEMER